MAYLDVSAFRRIETPIRVSYRYSLDTQRIRVCIRCPYRFCDTCTIQIAIRTAIHGLDTVRYTPGYGFRYADGYKTPTHARRHGTFNGGYNLSFGVRIGLPIQHKIRWDTRPIQASDTTSDTSRYACNVGAWIHEEVAASRSQRNSETYRARIEHVSRQWR